MPGFTPPPVRVLYRKGVKGGSSAIIGNFKIMSCVSIPVRMCACSRSVVFNVIPRVGVCYAKTHLI